MTNITRSVFQAHPFHLVSPSPWPLLTCISLYCLAGAGVMNMHNFINSSFILYCSFTCVILSMSFWFRDIIAEATYLGNHTLAVQKGLTLGVSLFIISEALFFLAVFWAYFHSALAPVSELGSTWPPKGIQSINPFELPLVNTIILLASGVGITYAHHCILQGKRNGALNGSIITVILAIIFTVFQLLEYNMSTFSLSDGIYGSCFYFGTGFHGFHVIIGTIFIAVGLWRTFAYHATDNHHLGIESGILYWHFVDVVWLILYLSLYLWGC